MTDKTVTVQNGVGFLGVCFILFFNFGDSKYDLYDAIMHWLMK
jgi:hypothetical protein